MSTHEYGQSPSRDGIECLTDGCGHDPIVVVWWSDNHAFPYCQRCGDIEVDNGGREYPLGEFYDFTEGEIREIPGDDKVQITDLAGSDQMWIEAKDPADAPSGFVRLEDTR